MSTEGATRPSLKSLGVAARRAVSVSPADLVRLDTLAPGQSLPLVIRPAVQGVDLAAWAADHREELSNHLLKHGGILFRGFDIPSPERFEAVVKAISGDLLEYKERSSPRHAVSGRVYTSTDYPPDQPIFLHNENSYQNTWPMRIFFYAFKVSETGGETPIADVRRVFERIDPQIRQRLIEKKWMVVRNYGDGFGLPWQTVYQTDNPQEVEEHAGKNGIQLEWKEGGRLRSRAIRPAAVPHPLSGEMVWFNHATFFHVSTLIPVIREALMAEFEDEDLPSNTYYGDGTPLEPEVLDHLRAAYHAETISFPWEQGDLLMLDNMMVAHGRAPFTGERKILVGMSQPCSWSDLGVQ